MNYSTPSSWYFVIVFLSSVLDKSTQVKSKSNFSWISFAAFKTSNPVVLSRMWSSKITILGREPAEFTMWSLYDFTRILINSFLLLQQLRLMSFLKNTLVFIPRMLTSSSTLTKIYPSMSWWICLLVNMCTLSVSFPFSS